MISLWIISPSSLHHLSLDHSRYKEAEGLYREAYEASLRVEGQSKPSTWRTLQWLARCIGYEQKAVAQAEPYNRELQGMLQGMLGRDHPDTLQASNSLASNLRDLGKGPLANVKMIASATCVCVCLCVCLSVLRQ
jgi:hypothetical protein